MVEHSYQQKVENLLYGYLYEVDFLVQAQRYHLSFLMLSQIIEVLGAFLDDKPLRAKDQSKNRFALALKKLFKPGYFYANEKDFLYYNYRCNMSHLLTSSNLMFLSNIVDTDAALHLQVENGRRILLAEPLLEDTKAAIQKLLAKIGKGEVKEKKGLTAL